MSLKSRLSGSARRESSQQAFRRRRGQRRRGQRRLNLELLENRMLLATDVVDFSATVSQFGIGESLLVNVDDEFIGAEFNLNEQLGGITNVRDPIFGVDLGTYGLQAGVNLHGKAGFDVTFQVDSGSVTSEHSARINHDFTQPTSVGNVVVQNSLSYTSGALSTAQPSLSASVGLDLEFGGSARLDACLITCFDPLVISAENAIDIEQEIVGLDFNKDLDLDGNLDHSLRVFGEELTPDVSADFNFAIGPLPMTVSVSPFDDGDNNSSNDRLGLQETLSFGITKKGVTVGTELGRLTQTLPSTRLSDTSVNRVTGELSDTSANAPENELATAEFDFGLFLTPILPGLGGRWSLSAGPATLDVTPISFVAGPKLFVNQTGSAVPDARLNYSFDRPVWVMQGGSYVQTRLLHGVNPGDSLTIFADGEGEVTVTPEIVVDVEFKNRFALVGVLEGTLEIARLGIDADFGALDADIKNVLRDTFGLNLPAVAGPLFKQDFSTGPIFDIPLFDDSFGISYGDAKQLAPFIIDASFSPSLNVNSKVDNGGASLRNAIRSANTIDGNDATNSTPNVISLGSGTFQLTENLAGLPDEFTGDLDIHDRDLRIQGNGISSTVIDASTLEQALEVHSGATLHLKNLTLNGAIRNHRGATLVLENVKIGGLLSGGQVELANGKDLTVQDELLLASSSNLVLDSHQSSITLLPSANKVRLAGEIDTSFLNNTPNTVEKITLIDHQGTGSLSGEFSNAGNDGAPINGFEFDYASSLNDLILRRAVGKFEVNTVSDAADANPGDGLADTDLTTPGLQTSLRAAIQEINLDTENFHNVVTFNLGSTKKITLGTALPHLSRNVSVQGSGVRVERDPNAPNFGIFTIDAGTSVELSGLTISGGHTDSGGGIHNDGQLTVRNSVIENNEASVFGGGIYNDGEASVINTTIRNNAAAVLGGGIDTTSSSSTAITTSLIEANTSESIGGGLHAAGPVSVHNSTLSGNTAFVGGGIAFSGDITVTSSTITDNSATNTGAPQVGGGISQFGSSGTITLHNTIVAGNRNAGQPSQPDDDIFAPVQSESSFNLIGVDAGLTGLTGGVNGNQIGTLAMPLDARLAPLADNGGRTKTHSLLPDSPAIDQGGGSQRAFDQRGLDFEFLDLIFGTFSGGVVDVGRLPNAAGGSGIDIGAFEVQKIVVDTHADCLPFLQDPLCHAPLIGKTTLRTAIERANADNGTDIIEFRHAGGTINLKRALPFFTDDVALLGPGPDQLTLRRSGTLSDSNRFSMIIVDNGVNATIAGATFRDGMATNGGAIFNGNGTLTIEDVHFKHNASLDDGGAIYNKGSLKIVGSQFSENSADSGGAIFNVSSLSVLNTEFAQNRATSNSGGAISSHSNLNISSSTFVENTAQLNGGAIRAQGQLEVSNSTISGNTATTGRGGGISNERSAKIVSSTVTNNQAFNNGGGVDNLAAFNELKLHNSIIAGNRGQAGAEFVDLLGRIDAASSFNIIGVDTGLTGITDGSQGNQIGSGAAPIDPGLAPLRDNGGPTRTHALLKNSPAIDAGSSTEAPLVDQRGAMRGQDVSSIANAADGTDIGAIEVGSFLVNSTSDSSDADAGDGVLDADGSQPGVQMTLRLALEQLSVFTGTNFVEFDLPAGSRILLDSVLPALSGDGIVIQGPGKNALTIERNKAGTRSFRIFEVTEGSTVEIAGVSVRGGRSQMGGGILNRGTLLLDQVAVADNTAARNISILGFGATGPSVGGGIANSGDLTVVQSEISHNVAQGAIGNAGAGLGGGVYNDGGDVRIVETTLANNVARGANAIGGSAKNGQGGAIFQSGGTVQIAASTLSNNRAEGGAGVLATAGAGNGQGGAIHSENGTLVVSNATLSNNSAKGGGRAFGTGGPGAGGGIHSTGSAVLLANTTLTGNTALGGKGVGIFGSSFGQGHGGGMSATGNEPTLVNTIVAGNSARTSGDDVHGQVNDSGSFNNLIGHPASSGGLTNGINDNQIGVSPRLGARRDNGGLTDTHALQVGSPAIDAGALLQPYATEVLLKNPTAYWKFDGEDSITGIAGNDGTAGNSLNGTIEGSPVSAESLVESASAQSKALRFDGIDDVVRIANPSALAGLPTDVLTIELMFRIEDLDRRQIIYEQGGRTHGFNVYFEPENATEGRLVVGAWKDSGTSFASFVNTVVAKDRTYHAALVFDARSINSADRFLEGYLDGVIFGRISGSPEALPAHSDPIGIGGVSGQTRIDNDLSSGSGTGIQALESNDGLRFRGTIDEVAVYRQALSPTDISRHAISSRVGAEGTDQRGGPFVRLHGDAVDIGAVEFQNQQPVGVDDQVTLTQGTTATILTTEATSLLANDVNADSPFDVLTVNTTPVSGPAFGTLTLQEDGTFQYEHNGSQNFSDSFVYELFDVTGQSTTATVDISITPPTVALTVDSTEIAEGSGATDVTATLSVAIAEDVTVNLAFDGAATLGVDFTHSGSQIVIPAGELSASTTITASQNSVVEANQTIQVDIASVTNAAGDGEQPLTAVIVDDDVATLSIDDAAIAEGDAGVTKLTFTVRLDNAVDGGFTVDFETTAGTATAGVDFTSASGTLEFSGTAGETQTVTVDIVGDRDFEPDETLVVELGNIQSAGGNVVLDSQHAVRKSLSSLGTSGITQDVKVVGTKAYLADGNGGLRVLDLADSSNILELGSFDTPGSALGVHVVGAVAYIADSNEGLRVLDVSDPADIQDLGAFDLPGKAVGVQVVGTTAYVAGSDSGLRVLDVSDAGGIVELGSFNTPGIAVNVDIVLTTAYVADGDAGLRILDVSDPANIREVGSLDTSGTVNDVDIEGGMAYVADGAAGLRVLDIRNPGEVTEIGSFDTPGAAQDVQIVGSTAYVADGNGGLLVLDVSDPRNIVELTSFDALNSALSLQVRDSAVFIADGADGFKAVSLAQVLPAVGTILNDDTLPVPDEIGIHRSSEGKFYIDATGDGRWNFGDQDFRFGIPGDTFIVGDWNGDGFDEIGVHRGNIFYLDFSGNGAWGPGDVAHRFGIHGDTPIVGDWDGNGTDDIGVHRGRFFFLDFTGDGSWNTGDVVHRFGINGDVPLIGDWDGDGTDNIGVHRHNFFFLDATANGAWNSGDVAHRFGNPGDTPLIGDWNGDGTDNIGVHRGRTFFLEYNGDGRWNGADDRSYNFGIPTDAGIAGRWKSALSVRAASGEVAAAETDATTLEADELTPIISAAIDRLAAEGLDDDQLARLQQVQVRIADLDGAVLGQALGNSITIDRDAAGHGWYVDTTPYSDEEFVVAPDQGLLALGDDAAVGRIDLLSVVLHELGHVLGLADDHTDLGSDQFMLGSLHDGIRRLPTEGDLAAVLLGDDLNALL